jgi:hypothetical protein
VHVSTCFANSITGTITVAFAANAVQSSCIVIFDCANKAIALIVHVTSAVAFCWTSYNAGCIIVTPSILDAGALIDGSA